MTLRTYMIRKCLLIFPVLFGISLMTFTLCHLAPGSPVEMLYGVVDPDIPPEVIERIEEELGLHEPIWMQYLLWLKQLLTGNFGYSYVSCRPVIDLISMRVANTLKLTFSAFIVSIIFSTILGTIAAVKHRTIFDYISTTGALFGISMPSYWIGILLMLIFSLYLGFFPSSGVQTLGSEMPWFESLIDQLRHMVLPVVVLSVGGTAYTTRMLKSSMLNVLNQDYITTARAKGLKELVVIYKHALRNSLLSVVTVLGLRIAFLLSGAVLVETIFAWPGLGRLIVTAANERDYPVIMAINMIISTIVLITNLITDILYGILDPRIRY